ncbi:autoinducer binding domain-containing protein [Serratia marcescens]|uniref:Autoinducer binding domain-containing protein n=1 Tax=Serratia marcescens TaxID=615 RepID=A0A939SVJ9_SERMA|nr:autoinducer binding domain-containing protein [Serratia marcescens]
MHFGVTNYPSEWVKSIKSRGCSILIRWCTARNRLTFRQDEQIMADAGLHFPELFEQAREFGVTHGYTFVLHDYNDNLVTLSLPSTLSRERKPSGALTDRKVIFRYCWLNPCRTGAVPTVRKMPHPRA